MLSKTFEEHMEGIDIEYLTREELLAFIQSYATVAYHEGKIAGIKELADSKN